MLIKYKCVYLRFILYGDRFFHSQHTLYGTLFSQRLGVHFYMWYFYSENKYKIDFFLYFDWFLFDLPYLFHININDQSDSCMKCILKVTKIVIMLFLWKQDSHISCIYQQKKPRLVLIFLKLPGRKNFPFSSLNSSLNALRATTPLLVKTLNTARIEPY